MSTRYKHGATGWVMRSEMTFPKTGKTHVSYWYGPDRNWGNTWGSLDRSIVVYPTRKELVAEFGRLQKRFTPQRVRDAELEQTDRWILWWERLCVEGDAKPDNRYPDKTLATRIEKRTGNPTYENPIAEARANYVYAMSLVTRPCASCRKRCQWVDDAWVCDACGDEWYPDAGPEYAIP